METYCTRPNCPRPRNVFPDLDNKNILKTVQQKFCTACGMPQILIGRYVPIKVLGRGGFGAAFLALDRYTPTMRRCVVKQFLPSGNLSPDQLEIAQKLFEREAEALEKLGNPHPQIPNLLAFFELSVPPSSAHQTTQFFYLVQEFIDGENMEEILERTGKFTQAETLEVLEEVLKILKFVHETGTIHRDIKPSNIMRDRQGRIHLLDFGAVKQVASSQKGSQGSSTGIYSMGFAPPEQMSGGVVYPATDLYALGVTCITLLTGKQPMDLYDAYSNNWNWRAYAKVNDRFEAVLNQMLLPTPSDRFQSADEVAAALKRRPSPKVSPPNQQSSATPVGTRVPPPPPPNPQSGAVISSAPATPQHTPSAASPPHAKPVVARPITPKPPPPRFLDNQWAIILGAMFLGFEISLLTIAIVSILGLSSTSFIILGIITIGLSVLIVRRIIEKFDFILFGGISLAIAIFYELIGNFYLLHSIFQTSEETYLLLVILLPLMGGLMLLSGSILFLLIYRILVQLL